MPIGTFDNKSKHIVAIGIISLIVRHKIVDNHLITARLFINQRASPDITVKRLGEVSMTLIAVLSITFGGIINGFAIHIFSYGKIKRFGATLLVVNHNFHRKHRGILPVDMHLAITKVRVFLSIEFAVGIGFDKCFDSSAFGGEVF